VTQGTQTTPGACNGAIAVGVFLGTPRSTQMTQKGCLDAGSYPHGIQAADFTGDGLVDLAVVSNVATA
jgi:hypothetical protein